MSHDACSVVLRGDVLVCSLANRPTTPEIVFGLRELLREHGVMTLYLFVFVSSVLIALLIFKKSGKFQLHLRRGHCEFALHQRPELASS